MNDEKKLKTKEKTRIQSFRYLRQIKYLMKKY